MKEQKENSKPKRYVVSEVLPNGEIIELVYREGYRETLFAVYDGNTVAYQNKIELPHEILLPYKAGSHLISKKVILFPFEDKEYGSTHELLEKIRGFIHKYVDVSPFFEEIGAYYAMFSWIYDRFNELAYLRALGDYGSGKSRLLQVIGSVCYKPMFVGGATTTSPVFRIIDSFQGTLILDEADYRFSDTTADIIKILNSGYQKGIPVLRSEGQGTFEVKSYDVFCPKIIATRKRFDDIALESRFLIEEMDKKELREDIPINLPPSFEEEALELRNQLLLWRFRNLKSAALRIENNDRTIEPRLNQIITPLLSIMEDDDARNRLKLRIKEYNEQLVADRGMSIEAEVFEALLRCFDDGKQEPTMKEIGESYNLSGVSQKDQLSPRRIGSILRHQLKLRARRTNVGFVIPQIENEARIRALKKKYGISEEMNDMNVVNIKIDNDQPNAE